MKGASVLPALKKQRFKSKGETCSTLTQRLRLKQTVAFGSLACLHAVEHFFMQFFCRDVRLYCFLYVNAPRPRVARSGAILMGGRVNHPPKSPRQRQGVGIDNLRQKGRDRNNCGKNPPPGRRTTLQQNPPPGRGNKRGWDKFQQNYSVYLNV